jgi:hypothetical protein
MNDLKEIRQAGLTRLDIGLETGIPGEEEKYHRALITELTRQLRYDDHYNDGDNHDDQKTAVSKEVHE